MKFRDRYADQHEAANVKGDVVRVCVWGGGGRQYLWVLNVETNEYVH